MYLLSGALTEEEWQTAPHGLPSQNHWEMSWQALVCMVHVLCSQFLCVKWEVRGMKIPVSLVALGDDFTKWAASGAENHGAVMPKELTASWTSLVDSQGWGSKFRMIEFLQSWEIFHWISTCDKEKTLGSSWRPEQDHSPGLCFASSAASWCPEMRGFISSSRKADEVGSKPLDLETLSWNSQSHSPESFPNLQEVHPFSEDRVSLWQTEEKCPACIPAAMRSDTQWGALPIYPSAPWKQTEISGAEESVSV